MVKAGTTLSRNAGHELRMGCVHGRNPPVRTIRTWLHARFSAGSCIDTLALADENADERMAAGAEA
jgi:hypothetical protein